MGVVGPQYSLYKQEKSCSYSLSGSKASCGTSTRTNMQIQQGSDTEIELDSHIDIPSQLDDL